MTRAGARRFGRALNDTHWPSHDKRALNRPYSGCLSQSNCVLRTQSQQTDSGRIARGHEQNVSAIGRPVLDLTAVVTRQLG